MKKTPVNSVFEPASIKRGKGPLVSIMLVPEVRFRVPSELKVKGFRGPAREAKSEQPHVSKTTKRKRVVLIHFLGRENT